jgi:pimeloyl-ACP methyl ester carboxylesterase
MSRIVELGRRRGTVALVCLTAAVLAGCMDAPTSSDPEVVTGPEVRQLPSGTPDGCPAFTTGASGSLSGSGALYLICVPPGFDPAVGSLVVYAPGSVPPQLPLAIRDDQLGGVPVSAIVTAPPVGFAFATTSYRSNGLIVVDATQDLQRLVAKFRELYGPIGGRTYAVGASEGGLIATLATERHSQLFDGTLSACGSIGDFQRQINYFDDFRLAFDFYFAAILAGSGISLGNPIDIPDGVIAGFGTPAQPGPLAQAIAQALLLNPIQTNQLPRRRTSLSSSACPTRTRSSNSFCDCWHTTSFSATTRRM